MISSKQWMDEMKNIENADTIIYFKNKESNNFIIRHLNSIFLKKILWFRDIIENSHSNKSNPIELYMVDIPFNIHIFDKIIEYIHEDILSNKSYELFENIDFKNDVQILKALFYFKFDETYYIVNKKITDIVNFINKFEKNDQRKFFKFIIKNSNDNISIYVKNYVYAFCYDFMDNDIKKIYKKYVEVEYYRNNLEIDKKRNIIYLNFSHSISFYYAGIWFYLKIENINEKTQDLFVELKILNNQSFFKSMDIEYYNYRKNVKDFDDSIFHTNLLDYKNMLNNESENACLLFDQKIKINEENNKKQKILYSKNIFKNIGLNQLCIKLNEF